MPFLPADERLRKVRIGIDSYTNTELVLDVIGFTNVEGKSGIGSVPTLDSPELFVDGNGYFTGVVTATTFFAGPTEITGGAFADNLTVTTLQVNGLSTFSGNVELDNNAKLGIGSTPTAVSPELFVDGDGYFTGVVTATTFFAGPTEITGGAAVDNLEVEQLNVSGLSTFGGFVTTRDSMFIDGDLTISGDLLFSELALVGIITFLGDADNVLGDPETGTLQVIGGVGIGKNVSIGSSLFVNTQVGIGTSLPTAALDVFGDTDLDDLNVSGLSTFASDVDINASVDISNDLVVNDALNVSGLSTFASDVDVNASVDISTNLTVDGLSDLDELNVAGLSTFASDVDINASVDISGDLVIQDALNVTGLSTFASDLDINASVDISNDLVVNDALNVTGLSTFASDVDINASVDISNDLVVNDALNVTGLSTFGDNVDINASVDVSGDLVIQDALNVTGLSTFASNVDINAGLDVDGFTELDATNISETLNVVGLSTFGSNVDINADLDVDGRTELDTTNISETLNVVGISTFLSDIDIDASIDVDGHTELDDLNVSGVSTFASSVDINADLDVDGRTELDTTNISETLNVVGLSTFGSNVDINADLDVDGFTELDATNISETLNVVGLSTFGSDVDINADLDVDGHTELDDLNVSGVSTFASDVDINASVDISGDLVIQDALNVTGLSTFGDNVDINASVDIFQTLNVTGVATFGNNVEITGDLTVNGNQTILNTQTLEVEDINIGIASADPKLSDAALDGAGITIHGAAGDKTLTWSNADSRMEFNTDLYAPAIETDLLDVTGVSTFGGNVDINASVDISNDLVVNDALNVTGLSTFASDVDINASVDISGDLVIQDALNVVGLSTFGSAVDINADLDVDGFTELDSTNISETLNVVGLSTFGSNVDINASVDISNDLVVNDALNVTGLSTFGGSIDANGDLDVDGRTELDTTNISETLNVVGLSTFGSAVDINADLDVDGFTELDATNISETLNVVGVSTFSSDLDINASVDISNDLVVNDALNVTGLSTFASDVDINASVDVSGDLVIQDALNVTGLSTFGDNVDINASVDISNDLVVNDALNVTGLSTFGDNVDINASVDISQTLNVTGVSTFGNNVEITGDLTVNGNQTILNTQILEVEDINIGIASADPKLSDAALDGAGLTIHGAAGDKTLTWNNSNTRMEFNTYLYAPVLQSINLEVSGVSTFSSNVDINASADISGDLVIQDALNVTGLSTFGSNVDINASVDISNDLVVNDALNVTGLSTLTGQVQVDNDINVTGVITAANFIGAADDRFTGLSSNFNAAVGILSANNYISGVITQINFTGTNLDVSVTVEPDNLTQANVDILRVAGADEADFALLAGIATNVIGGIASVTQLSVSGLSTFNDAVDINADVDISDDLTVNGNLTVVGLSTFQDSVYIGVGGTTAFFDVDTGNVGIGTTIPSGAADPNNTAILNAGIVTANEFYGSGAGLFDVFADARGPDGAVQYNNETNIDGATNFIYDDTNFRVGIGSTIPTVLLDVLGDVSIVGATTFTGDITVNGDSTFNGNINSTGIITATATDGFTGLSSNFNGAIGILSANNYISGVITQINFTGTNLDVSVTVDPGNLTQANVDILRVAGADESDFAVSAGVATNVIGGIASVTQLSVSGISTFEDNVYIGVGGTTAFFEVDTGNVGIGSTQPIAELDVNGGVNVSGVITAAEFVGIGSQLTDITFRQLSDVDGSNLVAVGGGTTTPDYLVIYDPTLDAFRFVDPKSYFGINNDFNEAPAIVDYGVF